MKAGLKLPAVTFHTRVRDEAVGGPNPFRWQDKTTADIFAGKRVVVFSLPGAFTPTCSSTHLPRYEELFEEIRGQGVDGRAGAVCRGLDLPVRRPRRRGQAARVLQGLALPVRRRALVAGQDARTRLNGA